MEIFDKTSIQYQEISEWLSAKVDKEPFELFALDATQFHEVCETDTVFKDSDVDNILSTAFKYFSGAPIDRMMVRAILMSAIEVQQKK